MFVERLKKDFKGMQYDIRDIEKYWIINIVHAKWHQNDILIRLGDFIFESGVLSKRYMNIAYLKFMCCTFGKRYKKA